MIEFPQPALIWSTNEDRNIHHYTRASRIKEWKEATVIAYRQAWGKANQPPAIVSIELPVKTRARRDPHNYCGTVLKAVIDGLVLAGAWPDDTPEHVGHREPVFVQGTNIVRVTWTPMQGRNDDEGVDIGDTDLPTAG